IRVVRAFVRERHETDRFEAANATLTDTSVRIGRLFVIMGPAITVVLHLATAAVLWFGGHRVDAGLVQVGALTAFMQYLLQILMAVMMGTFMLMMFPRAIISARRIQEVLDTVPTLAEPARPVGLETTGGGASVEFRDVTFAYPGAEAPVLDGVSFTAEAGRTTAIIGSTGAGKTTRARPTWGPRGGRRPREPRGPPRHLRLPPRRGAPSPRRLPPRRGPADPRRSPARRPRPSPPGQPHPAPTRRDQRPGAAGRRP